MDSTICRAHAGPARCRLVDPGGANGLGAGGPSPGRPTYARPRGKSRRRRVARPCDLGRFLKREPASADGGVSPPRRRAPAFGGVDRRSSVQRWRAATAEPGGPGQPRGIPALARSDEAAPRDRPGARRPPRGDKTFLHHQRRRAAGRTRAARHPCGPDFARGGGAAQKVPLRPRVQREPNSARWRNWASAGVVGPWISTSSVGSLMLRRFAKSERRRVSEYSPVRSM